LKSYKLNRAFLFVLIGISFLLPLVGLIGSVLGYNEGGHKGGIGGPLGIYKVY
jgi:hypothetical protein